MIKNLNTENYLAPDVEWCEIGVETGFAASTSSTLEPPENGGDMGNY
ncbi:MAG: hypothetical protein LBH06_06535 [Rikenellaceae bacterium]|jgi:hypothetical protein|nr:hypothetical protein [Rikenellaceae bacterium]